MKWIVVDMIDHKVIDQLENGMLAEAIARMHSNTTGHYTIIGYSPYNNVPNDADRD